MPNMPAPSQTPKASSSRPLRWIGALLTYPLLLACASTQLSQPVKPIVVEMDCPQLTIAADLLVVAPLTPIPLIRDNGDMEDALHTALADGTRDRGQLRELTAAEKQREADQAQLNAECKRAAEAQRQAIEDAARDLTTKVRRPFLSRLGIF